MKLHTTKFIFFVGLAITMTGFLSCGEKKKKSGGGTKNNGVIHAAFMKSANTHKIPVRYMIAAGLLESNLSPKGASVPYYDSDANEKLELGLSLTETAFGMTRKELRIPNGVAGDDLMDQVEAYGNWIGRNIDKKLGLNASASRPKDKYYWIWQLAKLHRNGEDQRRNVRVLWAKDLIRLLNQGKVWQDPETGEQIVLEAESPQINVEEFPADGRQWFSMQETAADISNARMFELTNESISTIKNIPTHLKVIHCPLSLSACLELQDSTLKNDVAMGAHFVIPQNEDLVTRPLQITQLEHPVELTARDGRRFQVTDAVVIMLVGTSGRYIQGVRKDADPTWFTAWQLKKLGAIISGVCNLLSQKYDHIDQEICGQPERSRGVQFQHQDLRANYRWGDIPDFDKAIFYAYLRSSDNNIEGEVAFDDSNNRRTFKANTDIELKTTFPPGVGWVQLQRAIRCQDETLVWETVRSDPIYDEKAWTFRLRVLDSGPNQNGRQFFRALVSSDDNKLMGWAIRDLFITGFDTELHPPAQACYQRETMEE